MKDMVAKSHSDVYRQDAELDILKILARYVEPTFIDVGAEKGRFSATFMEMGFSGFLIEPFPDHTKDLERLVEGTTSKFYPFAIDAEDRPGILHIACASDGRPLDFFHSLTELKNHPDVQHTRAVDVTCRSLGSLVEQGLLPTTIGILKIDTEGNDARVIAGLGELKPQVLVAEFLTPSLYRDWRESFPERVVDAASRFAFTPQIAVKHYGGHEVVFENPRDYRDGEWGNLFFMKKEVFAEALPELITLISEKQKALFEKILDLEVQLRAKEDCIQGMNRQLLEKESLLERLFKEQGGS